MYMYLSIILVKNVLCSRLIFVIGIDKDTVQKVKWSNQPLGAIKLIKPYIPKDCLNQI